MKDEIKEILNKLIKTSCANGVFLTANTRDKIIHYITTLQEENEKLHKELKNKPDMKWTLTTADGQELTIIQSERIDMQVELNKSLEKSKERIDKAIEFIDQVLQYDLSTNDKKKIDEDINTLIGILMGSDNNDR